MADTEQQTMSEERLARIADWLEEALASVLLWALLTLDAVER